MTDEMAKQIESVDQKTLKTSTTIDLGRYYKYDQKDLTIEITEQHYSNFAMMQVTDKDAFIDFLLIPGVKKDDKMVLKGIRIYMSHSSAQKTAEALNNILETVYKSGDMETYTPPKDHVRKAKVKGQLTK